MPFRRDLPSMTDAAAGTGRVMTASRHVLDRRLSSEIAAFIRGPQGHDIGDLVDRLSPLGDCAIFGGLPRDFARAGREAFKSDVDVVVDAAPGAVDELLGRMDGRRNRFGGYRLRHGRFDFDVWALQTTWAAKAGHVEVRSLTDLVKTTFFDCDAVLFHCRTMEIARSDRFWASIEQGIVDINLEANPHYVGTLARTLRILSDGRQQLAPRLAAYLAKGIADRRDEILDRAGRDGAGLGPAGGAVLDAAVSALKQPASRMAAAPEVPTASCGMVGCRPARQVRGMRDGGRRVVQE